MTIDRPQESHLQGLQALWKEAFGDSDAFVNGFFSTGFAPQRCRVLDWNGQCAAALYWFDCRWEGKKIAYLYAVATQKRFQGQGFCRRLMEDTHAHLQALGYCGAALVPGSRALFSLYEKLGYTAFCPMEHQQITAAEAPIPLKAVSPAQYSLFRKALLPAGGIEQTGMEYLATFTRLYSGDGCLFSVAQEGNTAVFQEFLGDPHVLPRILRTLGAEQGKVWLPGGTNPFAMYRSFEESDLIPTYLGLSFS